MGDGYLSPRAGIVHGGRGSAGRSVRAAPTVPDRRGRIREPLDLAGLALLVGGLREGPRRLLCQYIEQRLLGVKSGRGFYDWSSQAATVAPGADLAPPTILGLHE
jgi:hypothetical protein